MPQIPKLYEISEVAEVLRESPWTVRRKIANGELGCVRMGRGKERSRLFVSEDQLAAHIAERTVPAQSAPPAPPLPPQTSPRPPRAKRQQQQQLTAKEVAAQLIAERTGRGDVA